MLQSVHLGQINTVDTSQLFESIADLEKKTRPVLPKDGYICAVMQITYYNISSDEKGIHRRARAIVRTSGGTVMLIRYYELLRQIEPAVHIIDDRELKVIRKY